MGWLNTKYEENEENEYDKPNLDLVEYGVVDPGLKIV